MASGVPRIIVSMTGSTLPGALAVLFAALWLLAAPARAQPASAALPTAVQAELERARLPADALVAWIAELGPAPLPPRLVHRAELPVNPASLMKLYSTGAALELLSPAWTWSTPVLATGPLEDGVLRGDLVIQGRGDPSLTIERVWLLLRELHQRGVREVQGDIVLDGSAFVLAPRDAGAFDGERHRPYNVQPDALLLNLKTITLAFVPEPARGVARVVADVALAGVQVDATVPLTPDACGDWRGSLKADFDDPARLRFAGGYPWACGERRWPVAYAEPASYNARLVDAAWREIGGRIGGQVRNGTAPPGATLLFEATSPPLAAVMRDINKFSNNPMAEQLFLTLGLLPPVPDARGCCAMAGTPPPDTQLAARERVQALVRERAGCAADELRIDNGSGLSRDGRSSARCLGAWLQALWASPTMPELMSSLPVSGLDGTARRPGRAWGGAQGRAHLKTGSLRDVMALAGYVLGESGRRYALVAIVNHPDAGAARPALDALVRWCAEDLPR
jgi:D-alanyl-D-alanine carboxypeptidase/D-alanyl-D-alanine-endopeptidase (penicillin-binding protein 4)